MAAKCTERGETHRIPQFILSHHKKRSGTGYSHKNILYIYFKVRGFLKS